jgi:hypothetical protein
MDSQALADIQEEKRDLRSSPLIRYLNRFLTLYNNVK